MRQRIGMLSHQLVEIYKAAATERARLHAQEWESTAESYSVLAAASEFGDAIQGYARRISERAAIERADRLLRGVLRLGPFEHAELMNWRIQHQKDYPLLCQYLEGLDHLRLLLIVFLIRQSNTRRSVRRVVERGLVPRQPARAKFTSI